MDERSAQIISSADFIARTAKLADSTGAVQRSVWQERAEAFGAAE